MPGKRGPRNRPGQQGRTLRQLMQGEEEEKKTLTQKIYERSLGALSRLPPGISPRNTGKMARRMALFYTPIVHAAGLIGYLAKAARKGAASVANVARVKLRPAQKKAAGKEQSATASKLGEVAKRIAEGMPHMERPHSTASRKDFDAEVVKDSVRRLVEREQKRRQAELAARAKTGTEKATTKAAEGRKKE